MKIQSIHAFTRDGQGGNAALVVQQATCTLSEKQSFAAQQSASAIVFMDPDDNDGIVLDYFYPHKRSPLCLHGTLAVCAVYFKENPTQNHIRVKTCMAGQVLHVKRQQQGIFVCLVRQRCPSPSMDLATMAAMLNTQPDNIIAIPGVFSVGSPKCLVEVRNQAVLNGLQPNLEAIEAWSSAEGVSGCYVFCQQPDNFYAGRSFNHLDPAWEDAATGVAAGALALHLGHSITLLQGDVLGMPCAIQATWDGQEIQVGGDVRWT